jgi:hypothetical protein
VYPRIQEFLGKIYYIEILLGVGCWFVTDVLGQGVGPVLKGQTVQDISRNLGDEATKQRRSTSRKTEDVKLHKTEA